MKIMKKEYMQIFKLLKTLEFINKLGIDTMIQQSIISKENVGDYLGSTKNKAIPDTNIHIIIPAFNESKSIMQVIKKIHSVMNGRYNYQITVIDDGSSDNTVEILSKSDLDFSLEKNEKNLGKGLTLLKGFELATDNEIVLMIDGDGEHPPEEIPHLLAPILNGKADFVIGSRFMKSQRLQLKIGSYLKNGKKLSKIRKFGNWAISMFIYMLFHHYISDTQCGFRAFAPGIVSLFKPKYSRFEVETEMTISYIKKGVKIVEIPIDSGLSTRESHMNIILDSIKILIVILDLKVKRSNILIKTIYQRINELKIKSSQKKSLNQKKELLSNRYNNFNKTRSINKIQNHPEKKLSIVLPCYNESKTLPNVIQKINNLNLPNYEIIVVDDGSTDESVKILKNSKNVKVFVHQKNQGYGKTLLDGIKKSSGDLIITIDSDGQHVPEDIPILCEPILNNDADIVVGSRYAGEYYYKIPFVNRVGEIFLEKMLQIFFHQKIINNQGGFRVFDRKTLDIFEKIQFFDMAFTMEILMIALNQNYRIIEAPIHLYDRNVGKSRVKKIKLLLDLFHGIVYYSLNRK